MSGWLAPRRLHAGCKVMPLDGPSLKLTTNSGNADISAVCVIDSLTTQPTSSGLLKFFNCGSSTTLTCQQTNENWYRATGCGKNTGCDKVLFSF